MIFRHWIQATGRGVVCKFVKNCNYSGPDFQPPPKPVPNKKTKETAEELQTSYIVLRTNRVTVDYFYDEPGLVSARLIDQDPALDKSFPVCKMRIHLGTPKGGKKPPQPVVIQWGPWADNQRSLLYRFFWPNDYQPLEPFRGHEYDKPRSYNIFNVYCMLDSKGRLDLHNQVNDELNTLSISLDGAPESEEEANPSTTYVHVPIPLINGEHDYKVKVKLKMQKPEVTTSLKFRPFIKADELDVDVLVTYPLIWNDHQQWNVSLNLAKVTGYALYEHKNFVRDFFFNWGSQDPPDLLHFIPYTVQIKAEIQDFEVVLLVNDYNWVDTSAAAKENAMMALCGSSLICTCNLPYDKFLSETVMFRNFFTGNDLYLRAFLPATNPSSNVLNSLSKHLRVIGRDDTPVTDPFAPTRGSAPAWRGITIGWVDIASAPMGSVHIVFTYHPVPILRSQIADKTGTLRGTLKQPSEVLVRLTDEDKAPFGDFGSQDKRKRFDPDELTPDLIDLKINIGDGATVVGYGTLIKLFLNFKENYFGYTQKTAAMNLSGTADFENQLMLSQSLKNPVKPPFIHSPSGALGAFSSQQSEKKFDGREYRPLSVQIVISANDLVGYLPKHVGIHEPPCIKLQCENLKFEMDKTYSETKLQVVLAPLFASMKDLVPRSDADRTGHTISDGFLCLSVLQVRGHALFSGKGISLDQDTAEYGWLMDFVIGDIVAKTSIPHILNIITSLETFIFLFSEDEAKFNKPPTMVERCWHGRNSKECPDGLPECELEDEMKYRVIKLSTESVDISILESNPDEGNEQKGVGLLQLDLRPSVRLALCSSHIASQPGLQVYVPEVSVRQLVTSDLLRQKGDSPTIDTTVNDSAAYSERVQPWLEAASINLGPLCIGARLPGILSKDMLSFWQIHDAKTKRLYFMYEKQSTICGCFGACSFFGGSHDDINFMNNWNNSRLIQDPKTKDGCFAFAQSLLLKDQLILENLPEIIGIIKAAHVLPIDFNVSAPQPSQPPPVPIRRFPPPKGRASQELHSVASESERYYSASEGDSSNDSISSEETLGDKRSSRPKAPCYPPPPPPPPRAPPSFFPSSPSSSTISSDDDDEAFQGPPVGLATDHLLVNMLRQMDMDLSESPLMFNHYAVFMNHYTVHNVFESPSGLKGGYKLIVAFLNAQKQWDFVPLTHRLKQGFSFDMMKPRKGSISSTDKHTVDWSKLIMSLNEPSPKTAAKRNQNKEQIFASTKVIIQANRCLDVFLSPLVLETTRWYISSVESVVKTTHPSAILDAIHINAQKSLLEKYEAANITSDGHPQKYYPDLNKEHPHGSSSSNSSIRWKPKAPPKWEVNVTLPQIRICSLERAVVEEHISAFNMDPDALNLLSCASLVALSLDNLKFDLALSPHRTSTASASDGFTLPENQDVDNFAKIYTCDQLSEHLAGASLSGSLSIKQVGAQLWRLKKQSGFNSDVQVTEIPPSLSRCQFALNDTEDTTLGVDIRRQSIQANRGAFACSSPVGFIMAEMGLEDVRLDILKKPAIEEDNMEDGECAEKLVLLPIVDRNLGYARQHVQFSVDAQGDAFSKEQGHSIAALGAGLASSANQTNDHINFIHRASAGEEIHQRQPTFYNASGLLKFSNFWLSFPSPPAPTGPQTLGIGIGAKKSTQNEKEECGMFDWNMLSTASAAVSAWLSVGFRLGAVAKRVSEERSRRLSAVVAVLLTEVYDKHDSFQCKSMYPLCFSKTSIMLQVGSFLIIIEVFE